jgi:hypothetical protein
MKFISNPIHFSLNRTIQSLSIVLALASFVSAPEQQWRPAQRLCLLVRLICADWRRGGDGGPLSWAAFSVSALSAAAAAAADQ